MGTGSATQTVLYAAKSTEDKRGSIPGQLEECRAFAAELGLTVAAEYSEQDVSAYKGNRGQQLAEALRHVEEMGGTLIAQHSDRLARGDGRTARHLVEIALWAKRAGVSVRCVQDPSTFENLILATVMGERNMEDSRRKGAAIKAGMARRRAAGRPVGGRRYGYRSRRNAADERIVVPDPEQAEIVTRIYAEYLAGATLLRIARTLNHGGIQTLRGKRWRPEVIGTMIDRPIYAGLIQDGENLIEGEHEGLIDRETWEAARALRRLRAGVRTPGRQSVGRHLFRKGLLRCGRCGQAMFIHSERLVEGGLNETYRCYGHYLDPTSCPVPPQQREPIDSAVFSYFQKAGVDARATQLRFAEALSSRREQLEEELKAADAALLKATAGLERVKADYIRGDLTVKEWRELRDFLEPKIDDLGGTHERLTESLDEIERGLGLPKAEADLNAKLSRLSEAVEADLSDPEAMDTVRSYLFSIFEHFVLHGGEAVNPGSKVVSTGYWIEPVPKPQTIEGYEEPFRPVLIGG